MRLTFGAVRLFSLNMVIKVCLAITTDVELLYLCAAPQVAERSLFLWNNEYIAGLSIDFRQKVLPMIYPSLRQNETHWNETVRFSEKT